jgi:hypothetical protein
MSLLPSYQTKTQKDEAFERIEITDFNSLLTLLKNYEDKGAFFRGHADASWKLYTSAQREWIQKDLYNIFPDYPTYLSAFLLFIRNNFKTRIQGLCKEDYDISIFSILQHYGSPSPLLDFTSKAANALYFGTSLSSPYNGCELNSYFSIYIIQAGGVRTPFSNDLVNLEDILQQYFENMDTVHKQVGNVPGSDPNDAKSIKILKGFRMIYVKENGTIYLKIANPRIDLQNGLFLFSMQNPTDPFELIFTGKTAEEVDLESSDLFLPKIICLDIHKTLVPSIQEYLLTVNVTKNSLGLDTDDFGIDAFKQFLKYYVEHK